MWKNRSFSSSTSKWAKILITIALIAVLDASKVGKIVTLEKYSTSAPAYNGGVKFVITGNGVITNSIGYDSAIKSILSEVKAIEINGDSTGITVANPGGDAGSITFVGFDACTEIFIYGNVILNYQTFRNMRSLQKLYVESDYTIDLGKSGFFSCQQLSTVILKAHVIVQCWTFCSCPMLANIYYHCDRNPGTVYCGNKIQTFDDGYVNVVNIRIPYGSPVNSFGNINTEKITQSANCKIDGNIAYVFEGDKLRITGNGVVTKNTLGTLYADPIACGCNSNSAFKTIDLRRPNKCRLSK